MLQDYLQEIRAITGVSAKEIGERAKPFRARPFSFPENSWHNFYYVLTGNRIAHIDFTILNGNDLQVEIASKMFACLPIDPQEEVYVVWFAQTVLVMAWETFSKVWHDLYYPFDEISIFDDTLRWAVVLTETEHALYYTFE